MLRQLALTAAVSSLLLSGCASGPAVGKREGDNGYHWPYPPEPPASASTRTEPTGPQGSQNSQSSGFETVTEPPVELASIPPPQPLPNFPRSAEQVSSAPVASLIRQARQAREARQLDQAQAKLERALKIEPRNYFAWSALASVYLEQKNYEQAAGVAGKSNSLARGNIYVELDNYRVIQEARQAMGQSDAAYVAKAKADEIQLRLQQAP